MENVAGSEFYATLDLKDAYYQVMLDEASRDLTTFQKGLTYIDLKITLRFELLSLYFRQTATGGARPSVEGRLD